MMQAEDVVNLYKLLEENGIQVWVDGGWGVDALLGKQTRSHKDLDIAIQQKDIPKFRALLEKQGYKDVKTEEAKQHNFVLGDDKGHEIDVHVIVLDDKGNGIYGPIENGEMYPSDSLTGRGVVGGQFVRCISAEWKVKSHGEYKLKDKDLQDISALCEKFDIELPKEQRASDALLLKMLATISKNPGIRPSELNRLLNIPHTWNLRKELLRRGLVRKEKRGLAVYYYPQES